VIEDGLSAMRFNMLMHFGMPLYRFWTTNRD
jgi:hypothetical protein